MKIREGKKWMEVLNSNSNSVLLFEYMLLLYCDFKKLQTIFYKKSKME